MTKHRRALLALALAAATVAGGGIAATAANAATPSTTTIAVPGDSSTPVSVGTSAVHVTDISGLVQFAPPCGPFCTTDYQGHLNGGTDGTLACNADCTLPGAPVGALLYRTGNSPWRLIPANGIIPANSQLIVNDDFYTDNTGGFTVTGTRGGS